MNCREFTEFLAEYLSGTLPVEELAVFDEHLAECPWCEAYLQNYRLTMQLEKDAFLAPQEPVPADVPEELLQAILAARSKKA